VEQVLDRAVIGELAFDHFQMIKDIAINQTGPQVLGQVRHQIEIVLPVQVEPFEHLPALIRLFAKADHQLFHLGAVVSEKILSIHWV